MAWIYELWNKRTYFNCYSNRFMEAIGFWRNIVRFHLYIILNTCTWFLSADLYPALYFLPQSATLLCLSKPAVMIFQSRAYTYPMVGVRYSLIKRGHQFEQKYYVDKVWGINCIFQLTFGYHRSLCFASDFGGWNQYFLSCDIIFDRIHESIRQSWRPIGTFDKSVLLLTAIRWPLLDHAGWSAAVSSVVFALWLILSCCVTSRGVMFILRLT